MDSYVSSLTHSLIRTTWEESRIESGTQYMCERWSDPGFESSPIPPPPPQKLASYSGPLGWGHNRENFGEVGQDVTAHLILKLWHLQ